MLTLYDFWGNALLVLVGGCVEGEENHCEERSEERK